MTSLSGMRRGALERALCFLHDLAHEIAHGLGSVPGTQKTALPDLYENPKDNYTPADFNNFDIAGLFDQVAVAELAMVVQSSPVNSVKS